MKTKELLVNQAVNIYNDIKDREMLGKGTKRLYNELYKVLDETGITLDDLHEVHSKEIEVESLYKGE